MKRLITAAIVCLISIGVWAQDNIISGATHTHVLQFLETYLSPERSLGTADNLLESQKDDGSWDGIDYQSQIRGAWPTERHVLNFSTLACAYYQTGKEAYLSAARKALKYWYVNMPVCPNWWYNEIGIPRSLGPSVILIMKDLPQEDIDGAAKILAKSSFKQTGQNKIWQAEGVLMRAYLQKDEALMIAARDTIASEIRIGAWTEGIQPDWSFHQHGPQLQWGNYGGAFASVMSWLTYLFDGTPLAFSPEQRSVIADYIHYGSTQPVWKGWFDMNACGRQITQGMQQGKARSALSSAQRIGVEPEAYIGGRYFPYSDLGIYKTADWYASVRMESSRTIGVEHTNAENMRGRFAADGALLVRRDGNEYEDVAAAWNWHHVPGVTCFDDGKEIFGWDEKIRNKSDKVFGKAEGDYMVCAMEEDKNGLKLHKAWFFCPDGIVCLGSGITYTGKEKVVTGVEQCVIKEEPVLGDGYIFHNGITYVSMDGKFLVAPRSHSGNWLAIHPGRGDRESTLDLLDIYLEHGKKVRNGHYAYMVCPNGKSATDVVKSVKDKVVITENSSKIQSVSVGGKVLSVDWEKAEVVF